MSSCSMRSKILIQKKNKVPRWNSQLRRVWENWWPAEWQVHMQRARIIYANVAVKRPPQALNTFGVTLKLPKNHTHHILEGSVSKPLRQSHCILPPTEKTARLNTQRETRSRRKRLERVQDTKTNETVRCKHCDLGGAGHTMNYASKIKNAASRKKNMNHMLIKDPSMHTAGVSVRFQELWLILQKHSQSSARDPPAAGLDYRVIIFSQTIF